MVLQGKLYLCVLSFYTILCVKLKGAQVADQIKREILYWTLRFVQRQYFGLGDRVERKREMLTLSWPPTSQTVKLMFLYSTVSTLNPATNNFFLLKEP